MKIDLQISWLLLFSTDASRKNEPLFVKESYCILQLDFFFFAAQHDFLGEICIIKSKCSENHVACTEP